MNQEMKAGQVTVGDVVSNRLWQILGIVALAALVVTYRITFLWEWGRWWAEESEYSHAILIPIISGFLVWFDWKRISKIPVKPSIPGVLLLLPLILVQFAGHRSAGFSMAGLTIPFVMACISLTFFGWRATKAMWFPIAFLLFMCVLPASFLTQLSYHIQKMSQILAALGLKAIGYDATAVGTKIIFASGFNVEVAAACSGIRTLVMLFAFASVFAYMLVGPLWGRLSLVVIVPALALAVNSVRVFVVALVGENLGTDWMHIAHDYGGYVLVFISMYLLYLFAKVVKCRDFRSMPSS
jgi:exosortase